jgi:hypothetical protein
MATFLLFGRAGELAVPACVIFNGIFIFLYVLVLHMLHTTQNALLEFNIMVKYKNLVNLGFSQ